MRLRVKSEEKTPVFFKGNFLQSRLSDETPSFRPPQTDHLPGTPLVAWRARKCPEIVSNVMFYCMRNWLGGKKKCTEWGEIT